MYWIADQSRSSKLYPKRGATQRKVRVWGEARINLFQLHVQHIGEASLTSVFRRHGFLPLIKAFAISES